MKRGLNLQELKSRSKEVTRSTVQKSVCVLSTLPLFGPIKAKLEMITAAYFNEKDFQKVEVLADMYRNLKATINADLIHTHALLGLSVRSLVNQCGTKILSLFKLILLERKVLVFLSPVNTLCHTLLSLLSLFPRMIEYGLQDAALYIPPVKSKIDAASPAAGNEAGRPADNGGMKEAPDPAPPAPGMEEDSVDVEAEEARIAKGLPSPTERLFAASMERLSSFGTKLSSYWEEAAEGRQGVEVAEAAAEPTYSTLHTDGFGFPLSIFTKGSLCHPYQSLSFLDTLASDSVRSCVFGATNALFLQRKSLVDAVIRLDDDGDLRLEISNPELRKQVALTTADLRFANFVSAAITPDTGDIFTDATSWEGGDEWIRLQFRSYLLSLIASCISTSKAATPTDPAAPSGGEEDFGSAFVSAWKSTHNYRVVTTGHYKDLSNVPPGHPFAGDWTAADVKTRLHSLMETKEGRKLTGVVSGAGRLASQASSSLRSSFLNNLWAKD